MIVVLAYSSRDIDQAARLIRWIKFLSEKHGNAMRQESLLIVVSQPAIKMIRHTEIVDVASQAFGKTYIHTIASLDERGWPASCNAMFREALCHVEQHFNDDIMWLDPDAAPVTPDWLSQIKAEWEARPNGKEFMGAFVGRGPTPHMTGIAVYGARWRQVAPKLATADTKAWDTWAADQVVPCAMFTDLIQHEWPAPYFENLKRLRPGAVIYHQNKDGTLLRMLDRDLYHGELAAGKPDIISPTRNVMRHFFSCANATKKLKASGLEFVFVKVDNVGGAWRGVYSTESEEEVAALLSIPEGQGVRQITEEEYLVLAKKKATTSNTFVNSNAAPKLSGAVVGNGAAVVVEVAPARPLESIPASPDVVPENWESVVEMGSVAPPNTLASEKTKVVRAKKNKPAKQPEE